MNNLVLYFYFFINILIIYLPVTPAEIDKFVISPPKSGNYYSLGESVNLTCVVKNTNAKVVFARNENSYLSEDKLVYPKYEHRFKIDLYEQNNERRFVFQIKKLSWWDNNKWLCVIVKKKKTVNINIRVIGKIQMKTELIENYDNLKKDIDSPLILLGKGIRTNPYDLKNGAMASVTCITDCSSVFISHKWTYRNITVPDTIFDLKDVPSSHEKCSFGSGQENGQSTVSILKVNCAALKMVGSSEIMCTSSLADEDGRKQLSAFVLCPGGHKEWALTNGEIIGVSIGVGLAIMLLVALIMSAKHLIYSYRYGQPVNGIRV